MHILRTVTVTLIQRVLEVQLRLQEVWLSLAHYLRIVRHNLIYVGDRDDLFIASYPKSGTTWVQMIIYQLTSNGEMNFDHIGQILPDLDMCIQAGGCLDELPKPRIVKTHLRYDAIPKGPGKYIYVLRDGRDVAVSFYYHYRKYMNLTQPFEKFFRLFIDGKVVFGSWFEHVEKWTNNRDHINLLIVKYEDLSANLDREIVRIADFLGIPVRQQEMPRILDCCSFEFMQRHESKFDLANWRPRQDPATEKTLFIRKGLCGEGSKYMNEAMHVAYESKFNALLGESSIMRAYRR